MHMYRFNSMVSSAIWKKYRTSDFLKTIKTAEERLQFEASQNVVNVE